MNNWAIYLIIAFLITAGGMVYYIHSSFNSIGISDIKIVGMGSPGLGYVTFRAHMLISNPTPFTILVENVRYAVFLKDTMVAKNRFGGQIIEPHNETTISIDQKLWTNNIVMGILGFMKGEEQKFTIKGNAILNIFGRRIIRPFSKEFPLTPTKDKDGKLEEELEKKIEMELISGG